MLKIVGKCILFSVLVLQYLKYLKGEDVSLACLEDLVNGGKASLVLLRTVVCLLLTALAFLEVKTAVWLVIIELSCSTYPLSSNIQLAMNLTLVSGLLIYYSKISELKPLGLKRPPFK